LQTMGGEERIFYRMLGQLPKMSLDPSLVDIAKSVDNLDYKDMKEKAHSLKGSCGYIGAGPLFK